MDTTVPGIVFDKRGECNFCKLHDKMDADYPLNEKGNKTLQNHIAKIKKAGSGKKYDCVGKAILRTVEPVTCC